MLNLIFSAVFGLQLLSLNVESPQSAQLIQVTAVGLLCSYTIFIVILEHGSLKCTLIPADATGLLITIVAPLISIIALLASENIWVDSGNLIIQSLLLCITSLCVRILLNRSPMEFLYACFTAYVFISALVIAVDSDNLLQALTLETTDLGRVRFAPLNNHPNLVAHIFATGIIVSLALYIYTAQVAHRIFSIFMITIQALFILGTSSRGAMVALIPSVAIIVVHAYGYKALLNFRTLLLTSGFISIMLGWMLANSIDIQTTDANLGVWLIDLFEINSEYRGLDSGGSGRLESWPVVLDMASATIQSTLIGNGYRSWSIDYFGFSIDNSYINLFWEFGFFLSFALILALLYKAGEIAAAPRSIHSSAALGVVSFILIDSIFARYLIGIGNPTSLIALAFFLFEREKLISCAYQNRANVN